MQEKPNREKAFSDPDYNTEYYVAYVTPIVTVIKPDGLR